MTKYYVSYHTPGRVIYLHSDAELSFLIALAETIAKRWTSVVVCCGNAHPVRGDRGAILWSNGTTARGAREMGAE